MIRIWLALSFVLAAPLARADAFSDGTAAATRGDHATAATAFERAIAERGWSPGALLDLGNAYAGSGDRGHAILAYERGLVLAPADDALAANLAHTREEAGVVAPASSAVHAQLARFTPAQWTWFAVVAGLVACLAVAGLVSLRRARGSFGGLAVIGVAAAAVGLLAASSLSPSDDTAVVVRTDTARVAPLAAAEPAFEAPAGSTVEIERRRGDRVLVRDGDREGWLPSEAVVPILADRAHAHT